MEKKGLRNKSKVRRLEKASRKPLKGLLMNVESLGPEWRFVKVVSLAKFNQDIKNGIEKVSLGQGVYKSCGKDR